MIRAEINELETKETITNINETKTRIKGEKQTARLGGSMSVSASNAGIGS